MSRTTLRVSVFLALVLILTGADLRAEIIAQTGFNGSSGINPADYSDGATLSGKGAAEPSWDGTWTTGSPSNFSTSSASAVEGDQSLKMNFATGTGSVVAYRDFTDATGVVYIDSLHKVDGAATSGFPMIMYVGPNAAGFGSPTLNAGTATMINLDVGTTGGNVRASTGTGTGDYTFVDTGYDWTVNEWVRVTQEIHPQVGAEPGWYRVWVDRKLFTPATPLGFRSPSTFMDSVMFYMTPQGATSIYTDQFRVLTHNPIETLPATTGFEADGGYIDGQSVAGKGLPEDGWTGNWIEHTSAGTAIVQSTVKRDGDMSLKLGLSGATGTEEIYRKFSGQTGVFRVDYDVMIAEDFDTRCYTYVGHNSAASSNNAAAMVSFWEDGTIKIGDGLGNGSRVDRDSGMDWIAGEWLHVTQEIDVPNQLFNVWINGVQCTTNVNNPLGYGFRSAPTSLLDDIKFLVTEGPTRTGTLYFDNIRVTPEPSALALLCIGMAMMLLRRCR